VLLSYNSGLNIACKIIFEKKNLGSSFIFVKIRVFLKANFSSYIPDAHVETWTDDLAGGILFQDDPYPVNAYNERVQAQDRFLNLTYRSPSVIKTPEHHHRMMRASHSGGGNQNQAYFPHRAGLTRGLSLGELNPPRELLTPHEFDTKKVASHGTLKRLKLVKSPTDTQLFVPNHHGHHHHQLHHPLVPLIHDPAASGEQLELFA